MKENETVDIDMRWREMGWLQAFRLRLTGWLPARELTKGMENGVFERPTDGNVQSVSLTKKGVSLTDPRKSSLSDENCNFLADVLHLSNFEKSWFHSGTEKSVTLQNGEYEFEQEFKNSMLRALSGRSRMVQSIPIPANWKQSMDDGDQKK